MSQIKRKWDTLTDERRKAAINEVITFFKEERDEEIGVVAAENFLDFFLEHIGIDSYNKGVLDAKELLGKRFDDLAVDLDLLLSENS